MCKGLNYGNGNKISDEVYNNDTDLNMYVELEIKDVLSDPWFQKRRTDVRKAFERFINKEDDSIVFRRENNNSFSSKLGIKNQNNEFEYNLTSNVLIKPYMLYANDHNEEYFDFHVGDLLSNMILYKPGFIVNRKEKYLCNQPADTLFNKKIKQKIGRIEKDIEKNLNFEFSDMSVKFDFKVPNLEEIIKNGEVLVTDANGQQAITEKGVGVQRAFAISVLQTYALNNSIKVPKVFCIDEPELFLHPIAQSELLDSLTKISEQGTQIFLTTHSPYILQHFNSKTDSIIILNNDVNYDRIQQANDLIFDPISLGEISYKAFHIPSVDFHQRLFTKLYLYWLKNVKADEKIKLLNKSYSLKDDGSLKNFDRYLQSKGASKAAFQPRYKEEWKEKEYDSLPYIVRNEIDHPETLEDDHNSCTGKILLSKLLGDSTDELIKVYNQVYESSIPTSREE